MGGTVERGLACEADSVGTVVNNIDGETRLPAKWAPVPTHTL